MSLEYTPTPWPERDDVPVEVVSTLGVCKGNNKEMFKLDPNTDLPIRLPTRRIGNTCYNIAPDMAGNVRDTDECTGNSQKYFMEDPITLEHVRLPAVKIGTTCYNDRKGTGLFKQYELSRDNGGLKDPMTNEFVTSVPSHWFFGNNTNIADLQESLQKLKKEAMILYSDIEHADLQSEIDEADERLGHLYNEMSRYRQEIERRGGKPVA